MKKRIFCLIFAFLILTLSIPFTAFAADDEKEDDIPLSESSIEYDFERYLTSFELSDFKVDKSKTDVELIAMYFDSSNIYFYVYNPWQLSIYERDTNYVNLSAENVGSELPAYDNHSKYKLSRIAVYDFNVKTKTETDGLIIKYQIENPLNSSYQVAFDVSELEFRLKNGVISYPVGKKFIFTLQAYGVYNVTTYSSEVVNITELEHTYYRVQSNDKNIYEDIQTVYFAVDRELIKKNLEFTTVKINWEECKLVPILLVDDTEVEKAFDRIAGKEVPANFRYSFGTDIKAGKVMGSFAALGHLGTRFDVVFNYSKLPSRFYAGTNYYFEKQAFENLIWSEHYHNTFKEYDRICNGKLERIYLTFYCERLAKGTVPGEKILYEADIYDGYLDGVYSDDLILGSSGKLEAEYNIDQTNIVGKYTVKSNYLQYLLNGFEFKTKTDGSLEFDTFERFYSGHLKLSDAELSEVYLINDADIQQFRDFCAENEDSEIYFLRYSVTETKNVDVSMFGGEYVDNGIYLDAECYVCNASLVDTVLINDFDVIQIGFGDVKGGYTAYGVSMQPTDFVPDVNQFDHSKPAPDKDDKNYFADVVRIVAAALGVIVVTIICVFSIVIVLVFRKRGKKNEKKNN